MLKSYGVGGLDTSICWKEYERAKAFLQHPNVGTIGKVCFGKPSLTACIQGALGTLPPESHFEPEENLNVHREPINLRYTAE